MKKFIHLPLSSLLLVMMSIVSTQAQKKIGGGQPLQATISSSTNILCNGAADGSATVTASYGTSPYTYLWSPGGGTNATFSNLTAGSYTVIVTDNAFDTVYQYVTLSEPSAPLVINTTSITNVQCNYDTNGRATVSASGGTSPYQYFWANGNTTATDTDLGSGTYTVEVKDKNGCIADSTVTISSLSTLGVATSSSEASCFGLFNGISSATGVAGTPPYQYAWSPGGATTATATGLSAGTYSVLITDANGCSTSSSVGVTEPPPLVLTTAAVDSMAYAIVSGGTAPYTYHWYPAGSTASFVSGLSAGMYTVTVNDANKCSDSAIVDITINFIPPPLILSFGTPTVTCGNPSYFEFDIMAASSDSTIFDACVINIDYPTSEFLGDNLSDTGVIVTRGPNFSYVPGDNDYNVFNLYSADDSILQVNFGTSADSSPHGTILTPTPQALVHVKLKIQNSCQTGTIHFSIDTILDDYLSYYDITDSLRNHIDSGYTVTAYNCNYHCCQYDQNNSCTDSCYSICYDTTRNNTLDTTYTVYTLRMNYSHTIYPPGFITSTCMSSINITDFTPIINAGTNAKSVPPSSSIMYIRGTGFGNKRDSIQVSNANGPGMVALDSSDILYWSNNLIKVRMPGVLIKDKWGTPGTGPFKVFNACGESVSSADLTINYSIENGSGGADKVRPNIVMSQDTASIWWRCDTSVWNNPRALACVKKAIKTWNCYTGVNWKLSPNTIMLETTKHDSISVIYFSNSGSNFETRYTLMQTQPWILPNCLNAEHDSVAFYNEADIQLRRDKYITTGKHWSYDMTYGVADTSHDSNYFYDAILHELGHAHGLNHINDSLSLMFRTQIPGRRDSITGGKNPGPQTLFGAFDMINTSVAYPPNCLNDSILVTSTTQCIDPSLSVQIISGYPYNLNLFPNPINNGDITITYSLTKNSSIQFKILDCIGRTVINLGNMNKLAGEYSERVNVSALAGGVYLFTANINGECQTIKFIKL
jgi:hypothetical protein